MILNNKQRNKWLFIGKNLIKERIILPGGKFL